MTSRLTSTNSAWGSGPENEGTVTFVDNRNKPLVCVHRYNAYEWIELDDLSATLWMRYRHLICESIPHPRDDEPVETSNPTNKLIESLMLTLSSDQRAKWLKDHVEYKDKFCTECGSFEPEIKKCIHHNCSGMCATCFDAKNKTGFENCACCGQKQEMTCPCCQEDFTPDNMVKSEHCDHRICWACFGRSVKTSRPLSHCPMCRGIFCEKLMDSEIDFDSDTDDDMPALIDNEGDDPLSEYDEHFAMARAQEGMNFDAIIAAIANDYVAVRNNTLNA